MKNHEKLKKLTHSLLKEIGEDPGREGLLKTPSRVAKSWKYFSQGYDQHLEDIVNKAIFNESSKDMVVVRDVEFSVFVNIICYPFLEKHM